MSAEPNYVIEQSGEGLRLRLSGSWTIGAPKIEECARAMVRDGKSASHVRLDLSSVAEMDTAGAWLIDRSRAEIGREGAETVVERAKAPHAILLDEARYRNFEGTRERKGLLIIDLLAELGHNVVGAGHDFMHGVTFLGAVVVAFGNLLRNPARLRMTSIVYHIESFAFRGLPIIVLINFLVGCIVAQQGLFQLKRFGASTFTVDLIGILVLRELAVLLTSIMVAGRSGSAITAEIGSMKMREEIDALRVMGMDPTEVLVVPRLLALIISLPLLTFLSDIAALFGGLVVTWSYGGISPEVFLSRLQSAIGFNTFTVGLIKAPFMALVIGMIAAMEGLAVQGSAESLGRQVTASVVKSIFMVIVVDGLFAMFFAAIEY